MGKALSLEFHQDTHERSKHSRHHPLHNSLLDVYRLKQAREPGQEDIMQLVLIVEMHKEGVNFLGVVVAQ